MSDESRSILIAIMIDRRLGSGYPIGIVVTGIKFCRRTTAKPVVFLWLVFARIGKINVFQALR